jgi:hypothetical protein
MAEKKVDFTENERVVVEETFAAYIQTVTIVARLKGIKAGIPVRVAEDRSGLIIPDDSPGA